MDSAAGPCDYRRLNSKRPPPQLAAARDPGPGEKRVIVPARLPNSPVAEKFVVAVPRNQSPHPIPPKPSGIKMISSKSGGSAKPLSIPLVN